jgi:hypothetical protein
MLVLNPMPAKIWLFSKEQTLQTTHGEMLDHLPLRPPNGGPGYVIFFQKEEAEAFIKRAAKYREQEDGRQWLGVDNPIRLFEYDLNRSECDGKEYKDLK